MLQTKEKTIGEHRYQVTQLSAPEGRRLLVRLYKVLGPSLGAITKGLDGVDGKAVKLEELRLEFVGEALRELAMHLNEDDLEHLCEVMGKQTMVHLGGDKWVPLQDVSALHFAGRYDEMFKWIAFALETNYAGFFKGTATLGGLASKLGGQVPRPSESRSPDTLSGSSGAS
jgi:hypothetical protein